MAQSRIIEVEVPEQPDGAVLVLHGGASRRRAASVSPSQLSVLRMIPVARRIARAGAGRLAVFRLLNSTRGWNTDHTPVDDARWALDEIADRLGHRVPTCLVGHSLGGRAALLASDAPGVRSVVALAPWVYPTDVPRRVSRDAQILIVHGSDDRVASPERSAALSKSLQSRAHVSYVSLEGGKHAMIRRHGDFERLAAGFAAVTLLGAPATGVVARLVAGEQWISA